MRDRTVNVAEMVDNDTEDRFEDKLAEISQEVQQYNRNCSRTSGEALLVSRDPELAGRAHEVFTEVRPPSGAVTSEETKRTGLQA